MKDWEVEAAVSKRMENIGQACLHIHDSCVVWPEKSLSLSLFSLAADPLTSPVLIHCW